jgi:DNA-binding response OmpR family regulator
MRIAEAPTPNAHANANGARVGDRVAPAGGECSSEGRQHAGPHAIVNERSAASWEPGTGRGAAPAMRIAHLERDSSLLLVTAKRLERLGYEHCVLPRVLPPEQIAGMRVNAIVADLALVGSECWDWLEQLCKHKQNLGVVLCTRSSTVAERVRALRLGADDWLTKPCHPEELIARVEAVVRRRRRSTPERDSKPIVAGELEVRLNLHQAFVDGHSLGLTRREFQLLELLVSYDKQVLERDFIYQTLWGYAMVRGDRSVDVFVRKVRHKLERASPEWSYVHTHFGIGYRFAAVPLEDEDASPAAEPRSIAA